MTQNSSVRLAIFDFDDTLYNGQSLSDFLAFMENKLPLPKWLYAKIRKRFEGTSKHDNKLHKEFLLEGLTSFSETQFIEAGKEFYNKVISKGIFKQVLAEIYRLRDEGVLIVIASGGFDIYVNHFMKEHKIQYGVMSKLWFKNGIFTGKILGNECLGNEKAIQVKQLFQNAAVDWSQSYVFSDHKSDIPLFNMVGHKTVVIHESESPSWVTSNMQLMFIK